MISPIIREGEARALAISEFKSLSSHNLDYAELLLNLLCLIKSSIEKAVL